MINSFQAFVPSLVPPYPTTAGLRIFVGPPTGAIAGYVTVGANTIAVPTGFVNVTALSTTYVYLDMVVGAVRSNNSGFTGSFYPIAIVLTNQVEIVTLLDVRPDIMIATAGGGGSSTDVIQTFTASGTIALAAGQNLFGTCFATASLLQLPSAAGLSGQSVKMIKGDATGSTTLTGGVDGPYYLTNQRQYVVFESDGNAWYVMGNN